MPILLNKSIIKYVLQNIVVQMIQSTLFFCPLFIVMTVNYYYTVDKEPVGHEKVRSIIFYYELILL